MFYISKSLKKSSLLGVFHLTPPPHDKIMTPTDLGTELLFKLYQSTA